MRERYGPASWCSRASSTSRTPSARLRGVDGIVVSNHGGRQLDGARSSIAALPEIVDAVGDRLEVLFDGGVRSGHDVLKALALGARGCLIGRAYLYGLAAAMRRSRRRPARSEHSSRDRARRMRDDLTRHDRSVRAGHA